MVNVHTYRRLTTGIQNFYLEINVFHSLLQFQRKQIAVVTLLVIQLFLKMFVTFLILLTVSLYLNFVFSFPDPGQLYFNYKIKTFTVNHLNMKQVYDIYCISYIHNIVSTQTQVN